MSKLVQGLNSQTNETSTENGMKAYKSTSNACLNLFFLGSSYRSRSESDTYNLFLEAYREDQRTALKILAYIRDAREGTGERQFFRRCIQLLANRKQFTFNLAHIPEIGRWDDLLTFIGTPLQDQAFAVIENGLKNQNGLCAKWMPRKGKEARLLREYLKIYPTKYRHLIVKLTNVVETQMCNKEWDNINYSHVPSVANIKYNGAFLRNDEQRRREFLALVTSGKAKINATVLMPHQVLQMIMPHASSASLKEGSPLTSLLVKNDTALALWQNLKTVKTNTERRFLPVADVSGSMRGIPMLISIAMSIYLSERMPGIFQNAFVTFSVSPEVHFLEGNLYEKISSMRAHHPSNTNLMGVFKAILDVAVQRNLPETEMPTDIVIISDMEFDRAFNHPKDAAFTAIRKAYADSGYDMPNIIFWNVNARNDHFPIQRDSRGIALISGSSQNAINPVMSGNISPIDVMNKAINTERYEAFLSNE